MRLTARDLYRLREAHQRAKRIYLKAQLVQQGLDEMLLELERRYGILGDMATIDIHTGQILMESQRGQREGGVEDQATKSLARPQIMGIAP